MSKLGQIAIFTATESAAFAGGLYLWNSGHPYLSIIFWTTVTLFEHIWAFNTGAGLPFFSIPK